MKRSRSSRSRLRDLSRGCRPGFVGPDEILDDERVLVLVVSDQNVPIIGLEEDEPENEDDAPQPARVVARSGVDADLLSMLIYPVKPARFFEEFWEQRALVIRTGVKERLDNTVIEDYLLGLDVQQLVEASPSEEIHVWLRSRNNAPSESFKAEPSVALQCYRTGSASLYFRAPQPLIDAFVSAMGMALGSNFGCWDADQSLRGEIETFVSRRGNVTQYHLDFQENFTLQLRGVKRWTLRKSGVSTPFRGFTPHFSNLAQAVLDQQFIAMRMDPFTSNWTMIECMDNDCESSVVLRPGDIFYHPSGLLHKVETEEDSISINISMDLMRYSDYFTHLASAAARRDPRLRQHIVGGFKRSALEERLDLFKKAVSSLTVEDAFPSGLWRKRANESGAIELSLLEHAMLDYSVVALKRNPLAVALEGRAEEDGAWFRFSFNSGNEDLDSWLLTEFFMDGVEDAALLSHILDILSEHEALLLPDEVAGKMNQRLNNAIVALIERGVLVKE